MSSESVLVFDIEGQFGFFKVAEVTRATLSFPFTRTSIIGIIAAILGRDHNSYWEENDPLGNAEIALELMNPIQHAPLTFNYIHTRDRVSIGTNISSFLSKGKQRGFVTAVRLDLLRDIHYRIYFRSDDTEIYDKLKEYLENNWYYYPPYLGHANLLAEIILLGQFSCKKLGQKRAKVCSVIPTSILEEGFSEMIESHFSLITNIPIRSIVRGEEIVGTITENFMIQDKITQVIDIAVKDHRNIFQLTIDGTEKNIVFMPDGRNMKKDSVKPLLIEKIANE